MSTAPPMQVKRISPSSAASRQMLRNRTYRALGMRYWFPHAPLGAVVATAGAVQLLLTSRALSHLLATASSGRSILFNVAGGLDVPAIRGVPQEAIGALLVLVGVGLFWRSRLAWVLAFLLTLATVTLELSPLSTASKPLVVFNVALLVLLLLARRRFTRASLATGTLYALTGVLMTIGYGVMGSYLLGSDFRPKITNLADAVYFAVVTMSTVGYGDITPQTSHARLFAVSLIMLGLVVFATSLTAIAGPLIDKRMIRLLQPRSRKMTRTAHVIVVGDSPLARNAVQALSVRGVHATSVCSERPAQNSAQDEDLVIGDGSDTQVLRSVDIDQTRAVLALSDDDSYNAFVVLAAKELNPAVRTVVAVNDAAHAARIERVRPDVVLVLPLIGGELLAMALSGEEIKADVLINQLLKLG